MAKQYTLTDINNVHFTIIPNSEVVVNGFVRYYILRLEVHGTATNGGASKPGVEFVNVGSPSDTKFTAQQIYTRITQISSTAIANTMKNLYLDLIGDDISV